MFNRLGILTNTKKFHTVLKNWTNVSKGITVLFIEMYQANVCQH